MSPNSPIPDIPGVPVTGEQRWQLNQHIAQLCGVRGGKFPGAQPVSFNTQSIKLLETKDFWVCEKSDGVRVLLFIVFNTISNQQEVFFIDRHQDIRQIEGLHFTHWDRPQDPLTDTLIDGELIIDVDPKTGEEILRYYAFDCLVIMGENIMKKPLVKRYARLREWVIVPRKKALVRFPEWAGEAPFEIVAKVQELSYHVSQVLSVHIPKLQHGHDGLIFTCAESEYVPATDELILKWKPPSENSIDFMVELRFPPVSPESNEPDYFAKPVFLLNQWMGSDRYEFFDELDVDDNEWERMKESGIQYDGKIVEVTWDKERQGWRMMRLRDDKPDGNHSSTVAKVLASISDPVEMEDILGRQDEVRAAWKQREAQRSGRGGAPRPPQQQARRPPPPASGPPPRPQGPQQGVVVGLKR